MKKNYKIRYQKQKELCDKMPQRQLLRYKSKK